MNTDPAPTPPSDSTPPASPGFGPSGPAPVPAITITSASLNPPPLPPGPARPVSRWALQPFDGPVHFGSVTEGLLKHPGRILHAFATGGSGVTRLALVGSVLGLAIFGLLLGAFSGGIQLWAAPLKVAGGMAGAVLICLPSLYIFSALGGVDATLSYIVRVLVAAVALASLLLLGFAPVLWVFSQSTDSVPFVGFLALVFWLIALCFGLRLLLEGACARGAQSLTYVQVWMAIFVIVTLQTSTALRPIIGTADTFLPVQKRFFVQYWIDELSGVKTK